MVGQNSSLLSKVLETRTVLRVLSIALLFFGIHIVFAPNHFHRFYLHGEVNTASFFYLKFWGIREIFCSVALSLVSYEASDDLCRRILITFFLCLSPMQLYEIYVNGALNEVMYWPILTSQVFFAFYMISSIAMNSIMLERTKKKE